MKGTIVVCLKQLVEENFGADVWSKSLKMAGLPSDSRFLAIADVDDAKVLDVIGAVCKVGGLSAAQAFDAFGDYWVRVYSQKLYGHFYNRHKTAKDMLLAMDDVHRSVTNSMENASPPRFRYEWKTDKKLIIHYESKRGLIDLMVSLVKGVGKFYGEDLKVGKLSPTAVGVVFP